jgi:nucleoside-diphosphate-sugar epimerase
LERAVEGIDTVFHLAALNAIPYSYLSPIAYVRTNVEGTLNVLQASAKANVSLVIHTSTSEVYGTARYVPIDEEHRLQGQSPYSASKIGADKIAESFHLTYGLPIATIRPFNAYGPRQSARAIIPTIISQALTQPTLKLGSLEPTRDLNYVADTVEGFLSVAECPEAVGQVFNIGSGQEISIGDLVITILELLQKDLPVETESERLRPESSEVFRLLADNSKAAETLGWQPRFTLKEGLAETIEWVKQNIDSYRADRYSY